jgi:molecular chaperone DnaK (HSP70)
VSVVQYSSFEVSGGKRVGVFEVKAKAWDAHLGGFRFDLRLAEFLADKFNDKWAKKG